MSPFHFTNKNTCHALLGYACCTIYSRNFKKNSRLLMSEVTWPSDMATGNDTSLQSLLDLAAGAKGGLPPGKYLVCFRKTAQGPFRGTGLSVTLQQEILALEVNHVRPNNGLDISIPQAPKVLLKYLRDAPGMPGDSLAFIDPTADCSLLCGTREIPDCDSSIPSQSSRSGTLSAHSSDNVLSDEECFGFFFTEHCNFQRNSQNKTLL